MKHPTHYFSSTLTLLCLALTTELPGQSTAEIMQQIRLPADTAAAPSQPTRFPAPRETASTPAVPNAPAPQQPAAKGSKRTVLSGRFALSIPPGWNLLDSGSNMQVVRLSSKAGETYSQDLTIQALPDSLPYPLAQVFPVLLDGMRKQMPGVKFADIEEIVVAGQPALSVDCIMPNAKPRMGKIQMFIYDNQTWLIAAAVFDDEDGPPALEQMDAMIRSLEINKP
jgi:hypothetical protein